MLNAILNRCLASSTHKETEKLTILVLYAWICTRKGPKPNAKTSEALFDSGTSATLQQGSLIKKL